MTDIVKPTAGILAAMGGFITSLGAFLQVVTLSVGLIGAIFGCAAGYYTFRNQRRKFLQAEKPKTLSFNHKRRTE